MSRHIDPERIASGELTDDEVLYLQDRGLLPDDIEPLEIKYYEGGNVAPASTPEEIEGTPAEGVEYTLSDGDEEDYDEGWTNVQRRAELTNRGLAVDGKKEELIARLLRSDADELTEEDQAPESEED